MSFATPIGLLALLAIPAVVALHLFRRKFPTRRIAGLFLFAPDRLSAAAGRRRTRLLHSPSLWLELAAAALLSLWLGGLTFGADSVPAHLVFVVDDSASVSAVDRDGVSSADRIRAVVAEILDAYPADTSATVVSTGPRPEILVGPRQLAKSVAPALAAWSPWRPDHDPGPALDLGTELAGRRGLLWFLTDRPDVEVPPRYSVRAVGAASANTAILSASRRVHGTEEKVFADLMTFGLVEVSARLSVVAGEGDDSSVVASQDVALTPGRPVHLALEFPRSGLPITLELGDDALAIDNRYTLLPEPPRIVRVGQVLDEEVAEGLELSRVLGALEDVRLVESRAAANLLFAAAPGPLGPGRSEVVVAPPPARSDAWIGPFLLERQHHLLEGVTLDGVVWSAGRGEVPGLPLVLAGTQVLAGLETIGESLRVRLNVDIARSNLTTSPDWPILISNLVAHVREHLPGAVAVNLHVGGLMRWRHDGDPAAVEALRLEDPRGRVRPGRGVRLISWSARTPGVHRLLRDDVEIGRFSANFVDAGESDLTGCGSDERLPEADAPAARGEDAEADGGLEARILAFLLLLVVAGDWWVLRTRGSAP